MKYRTYHQGLEKWLDPKDVSIDGNGEVQYGCRIISDSVDVQLFTGRKDRYGQEIYEGDIVWAIVEGHYDKREYTGEMILKDGTYCLKALNQSEGAIKHSYVDVHEFWDDGTYEHHSIEILDDFDMQVIGNRYNKIYSFS